tara:strand:- start:983 stop:1402 length:420 start_codon:yes stop_codon:yes gene_type:complete
MEFTITAARNPQWVDSNHNRIDLEVNFAELEEEWLPYTADPLDVCEHSRTLYANAVAGDYGQVSNEYVLTEDDMWTPVTATNTKISSEALVQILLEKGVITDEEVDEILVDEEYAVGFRRPTKDGSNPVYHSPLSGSGS